MLHDLNQTEHRTDNADGRRIAGRRFKHLGNALVLLAAIVDLQFHHLAQIGSAHAVDRQHQAFFQKRILNLRQLAVQREQPFAACLKGIAEQIFHQCVRLRFLVPENVFQLLDGLQQDAQRKLHHHGAQGSAEDDQSCRRLQHLGKLPSVQNQTKANAAQRYQNAANGTLIHNLSVSPPADAMNSGRDPFRVHLPAPPVNPKCARIPRSRRMPGFYRQKDSGFPTTVWDLRATWRAAAAASTRTEFHDDCGTRFARAGSTLRPGLLCIAPTRQLLPSAVGMGMQHDRLRLKRAAIHWNLRPRLPIEDGQISHYSSSSERPSGDLNQGDSPEVGSSMFSIIGILLVFAAVLGGFLMEKGPLLVLMQPSELVIIGGAAIGTMLAANPMHVIKKIIAGLTGGAVRLEVFQSALRRIPEDDVPALQ